MKASVLALLPILVVIVACQSAVDPYFDEVADEQVKLVDESTAIIEAMETDLEVCERSVFSATACDRAFDKFDEFRMAVDETRATVRQLDPPPEAASWHQDYLDYLQEASTWANSIVTAYYGMDFDTVDTALAKIDDIVEEEDRLIVEFEEIQKEMGAE